jgi:hypothetical protein
MPIVPNMVLGEDGEYRIVPETRADYLEDRTSGGSPVSGVVRGTPYDHAVYDCIQDHSFLSECNSPDEIETWARQWVRDDAKRERTRLIYGKSVSDAPPIVFEIIDRAERLSNEHSHPLAGTFFFRFQRDSLSGAISALVAMRRHEELLALSTVIKTIAIRDFRMADDPFWKTHAGRVILIWNSELKKNRLIDKQALWDGFQQSGGVMALNKFQSLLKKIGLNGLPGEISSKSPRF